MSNNNYYDTMRYWIYDSKNYMVNIPYSMIDTKVKNFLGIKKKKDVENMDKTFLYKSSLFGKVVSVQKKIPRNKFDKFMKSNKKELKGKLEKVSSH